MQNGVQVLKTGGGRIQPVAAKNITCKECGYKFHHCTSCGTDGYQERGFCSPTCMGDWFESENEKLRAALDKCVDVMEEMQDDLNEFDGNLQEYVRCCCNTTLKRPHALDCKYVATFLEADEILRNENEC